MNRGTFNMGNDGQDIHNTNSSSSTFHAPLPNRRRHRRPLDSLPSLHTSHIRSQPSLNSSSSTSSSLVPALSSPLRMNESNEVPEPSVFLTPHSISRKRSHFTASSTNTSSNPSSSLYYTASEFQNGGLDFGNSRFTSTNESNLTNQTNQSTLPDDNSSPTTNRFGSWSRKTGLPPVSHFSEPQMSLPSRPPQGEFSFQAQAPSSSSLFGNSSANQNVEPSQFTSYSSNGKDQIAETSSMAFARLARSQRQQQEARRMAASGGIGDNSNTNEMDDHQDGPAVKKRRGMASTIVDSALNAALYTGAAALTAYSLWSSWGRKGESAEQQEEGDNQTNGGADEAVKLPPGGLSDEPPPPYTLARNTSTISSPSIHSQRPVHVFVSSRRRRPVFATHRSARNTPRKKQMNTVSQDSPSPFINPHQTIGNNVPEDNNDDDDDDDDDEMFKRFQSKMSNLIEEGTKALHAKADLSEMDLEDEDEISFHNERISPSKSEPRLNSLHQQQPPNSFLPRSQTTAFTFGNDSLRRPYQNASSRLESPTTSPRTPFLSLARRDPDSPYGRLSRPGSTFQSPNTSTAKRRL